MNATAVADFFQFFRSYISNPRQVSAIAPSGQSLARLMTQEIVPGSGPVIELGPGTGIFTKALVERGVPEHDLLLVEYGSDFIPLLQQRFPGARVLWMDARQLSQHERFMAPASAVVSGLPLLSMTPRKVIAILSGAFRHLREEGTLYQFTYGPRCPVPRPILDRLGLKASLVGRTALNIPPASVYRVRRRHRSLAMF
ncbi:MULTISPECIES: class I SAM-dependent methyltransferase [unclassified Bradyrhizobium]|uniref:class I SAM-dependent methyltransferase n=1 Tax=unclassified Bradyrhizobium TaxID=2631580 RepID=UPI0020B19EC7|nr:MULTISPECIES: SAM-dependent methyltransferase [unclassified Bradyrhizobium]MCP3381761.1 SAM-dependent methyltransferase [Bradyrhizobium sp. CCGUVB4N]MCP3442841.1 SAM-dependent methyltransferase [Bradyrhizobium sp. CCGUVB14]